MSPQAGIRDCGRAIYLRQVCPAMWQLVLSGLCLCQLHLRFLGPQLLPEVERRLACFVLVICGMSLSYSGDCGQ